MTRGRALLLLLSVSVAALCGCLEATAGPAAVAKVTPVCKKGHVSTKAHPCTKPKKKPATTTSPAVSTARPKTCPIISATGLIGISGNRAGGAALTDGASGTVTIGCTFLADGLTVQIQGHSFASVTPHLPGDTCTAAGDTLTCKLNVAGLKEGLAVVGAWQDSLAWLLTPADPASTDTVNGSCGLPVVLTLTTAGAQTFSTTTKTVCAFAAGDPLR